MIFCSYTKSKLKGGSHIAPPCMYCTQEMDLFEVSLFHTAGISKKSDNGNKKQIVARGPHPALSAIFCPCEVDQKLKRFVAVIRQCCFGVALYNAPLTALC